jgi:hypothetical protein
MPYIDTSTIIRYKDITALRLALHFEVVAWIGALAMRNACGENVTLDPGRPWSDLVFLWWS